MFMFWLYGWARYAFIRSFMRNAQCFGVFLSVFVYTLWQSIQLKYSDLSGLHAIYIWQLGKGGKKKAATTVETENTIQQKSVASPDIAKLMVIRIDA